MAEPEALLAALGTQPRAAAGGAGVVGFAAAADCFGAAARMGAAVGF
jgi:hypothetical protein